MRENPNYYAIIPANIRYNDNLPPNAKLLYGEITALCNDMGVCWATNEYFAKLYKVSERTITEWIKKLQEDCFIKTEIQTKRYEDGTVKKIRVIHIENLLQNHVEVFMQNHIEENFRYNNTSKTNNIKENKISKDILLKKVFKKPTIEEVESYCQERNNNINPDKFYNHYESVGWKVGKTPMKDWKAAIRTWENNNKNTAKEDTRREFVLLK